MKLESFVSETLKQVINGIKMAQTEVKDRGASIVPPHITFNQGSQVFDNKTGVPIDYIEFNVAVTTTDGVNKSEEESIYVGISGVQGEPHVVSPFMSRIKFSVPMLLPKDPSNRY